MRAFWPAILLLVIGLACWAGASILWIVVPPVPDASTEIARLTVALACWGFLFVLASPFAVILLTDAQR